MQETPSFTQAKWIQRGRSFSPHACKQKEISASNPTVCDLRSTSYLLYIHTLLIMGGLYILAYIKLARQHTVASTN